MTLDIKICGLKTAEALEAALAQGASHVGFIFFPKSPRHVTPEQAASLAPLVRGRAKIVAVSVNASDAELDAIVTALGPDMLQLHGSETPERVREVKARFGLPVMKAFAISDGRDLEAVRIYRGIADRMLLDAKPPKDATLPGGNGVAFDWNLLTGLDRDIEYMLSGGLNAANIGDALARSRPSGIDISSGIESAPGVKDKALIENFFKAVRAAQRNAA